MKTSRLTIPITIVSVLLLFLFQIIFFIVGGDNRIPFIPYNTIRLFLYGLLTLLCSLFVFFTGNGLNDPDSLHLKYAYLFLLTGTVIFITSDCIDTTNALFGKCFFAIGNIYFYVMHIAFIFRHLRKKTTSGTRAKSTFFIKALIACIAVTIILPLTSIFLLQANLRPLLDKIITIFFVGSCIVYAVIIIIAIISAYKTIQNDAFPSVNSVLITIGYTSFLFCEIIVVIGILFTMVPDNNSIPSSKLRKTAAASTALPFKELSIPAIPISKAPENSTLTEVSVSTWNPAPAPKIPYKELSALFYTPAFLLLALSGLKYKK